MPPAIATVVYCIAILGLFWLDRDEGYKASKALWIPVVWLLISGSRMVSEWLQVAPATTVDQYLEGSALDRLVLGSLLAAGLIVLVSRGTKVVSVLRANGPILLFFFYCAASVLWSDYPDVAFKRWTKAVGDLVMVLVVLTDDDPLTAVKRLLARAGFLLIPASVLLIKYYPDLGRGYNPWVWTPYYTGVTTTKNILGMISLIFGLGSLWRIFQEFDKGDRRRRTGRLIAHGALLAMVLWLFWVANSVTSLSCFLLGGGLLVVTRMLRLAQKPFFVHLFVAAVLIVSFSALFLDTGTGLVNDLGRDATLSGRTALWNQLLGMAGNSLFGTGFESFWLGQRLEKLWSMYWWHPNEAHNGYLEVFLNLGWTGVALIGLVMVTGYRNVIAAFRREPGAGSLRLTYFLVAVTYNFTEAGFRMMDPIWIIFLTAITVTPEATIIAEDLSTLRFPPPQSFAHLPPPESYVYEDVV
jgi:exopolysaccharide production protein ExoQ